jgi:hypothetical protein
LAYFCLGKIGCFFAEAGKNIVNMPRHLLRQLHAECQGELQGLQLLRKSQLSNLPTELANFLVVGLSIDGGHAMDQDL